MLLMEFVGVWDIRYRDVGLVLRFEPFKITFLHIFMISSVQRFEFKAFFLRYLSGRAFDLDLTPGSQASTTSFVGVTALMRWMERRSKSGAGEKFQEWKGVLSTVSILHRYKHLQSAAWADPTLASDDRGTDYLPNAVSQRQKASWLLEFI